MINKTNIKIPKKYQDFIEEVWKDSDGYWANLTEASLCADTESHFVHEDTVRSFLLSLRNIYIMEEKEYIDRFGTSEIEKYRKDYERLPFWKRRSD